MPWLWIAVALGCDATPGREQSTVRREQATADAASGSDMPDASSETSIDIVQGQDAPEAEAETHVETAAEVADGDVQTVAEVADGDVQTVTDTETETVADADGHGDTDGATQVDSGPVAGEPCQVGSLVGRCVHVADCDSDDVAAEGFCEGGPQRRCCLDGARALERCSAARAPGACMATSDCPAPGWRFTSGLCPGPADIRCCTSTLAPPTCDPDVRPTPNDGLVEEPGDPGCAPGMARVPAARPFCMDRFEASLVLDGDPSRSWSPYHNPGAIAVRAVSTRYSVPQGYIDQVRASAACARAGKRLCTSDEWLYACRGDAGWTYPYGPVREDGRCNDDRRQHVAVELFGTSDSWIFSEIDNACLAQLPASLDLAGENEGCQTPTGLYDLMGNLHEWVDDPAGTFRGGFFDDTVINGQGCLYRTTAHTVSHWDYSTGFRCCAETTFE